MKDGSAVGIRGEIDRELPQEAESWKTERMKKAWTAAFTAPAVLEISLLQLHIEMYIKLVTWNSWPVYYIKAI